VAVAVEGRAVTTDILTEYAQLIPTFVAIGAGLLVLGAVAAQAAFEWWIRSKKGRMHR
jgi:hypothetical protein